MRYIRVLGLLLLVAFATACGTTGDIQTTLNDEIDKTNQASVSETVVTEETKAANTEANEATTDTSIEKPLKTDHRERLASIGLAEGFLNEQASNQGSLSFYNRTQPEVGLGQEELWTIQDSPYIYTTLDGEYYQIHDIAMIPVSWRTINKSSRDWLYCCDEDDGGNMSFSYRVRRDNSERELLNEVFIDSLIVNQGFLFSLVDQYGAMHLVDGETLLIVNEDTSKEIYMSLEDYYPHLLSVINDYYPRQLISLFGDYIYYVKDEKLFSTHLFSGEVSIVYDFKGKVINYYLNGDTLIYCTSNSSMKVNLRDGDQVSFGNGSENNFLYNEGWLYFFQYPQGEVTDKSAQLCRLSFETLNFQVLTPSQPYETNRYIDSYRILKQNEPDRLLIHVVLFSLDTSRDLNHFSLYINGPEVSTNSILTMGDSNLRFPERVAIYKDEIFFINRIEGDHVIVFNRSTGAQRQVPVDVALTIAASNSEVLYTSGIYYDNGYLCGSKVYALDDVEVNKDDQLASEDNLIIEETFISALLQVSKNHIYIMEIASDFQNIDTSCYFHIISRENNPLISEVHGQARTVFIDQDQLYFARGNDIYRANLDGSNAVLIHKAANFVTDLAVFNGEIYYAGNGLYRTQAGAISVEVIDQEIVTDFLIDKGMLLYAHGYYRGEAYYYRYDLEGSEVTKHFRVENLDHFHILTADLVYVYDAETGDFRLGQWE